jgi:hypothetical protein
MSTLQTFFCLMRDSPMRHAMVFRGIVNFVVC